MSETDAVYLLLHEWQFALAPLPAYTGSVLVET